MTVEAGRLQSHPTKAREKAVSTASFFWVGSNHKTTARVYHLCSPSSGASCGAKKEEQQVVSLTCHERQRCIRIFAQGQQVGYNFHAFLLYHYGFLSVAVRSRF